MNDGILINSYGDLCSLFYDIDKPAPADNELNFYKSFIEPEMDILERMCGSGRFLVSLLDRSYHIDGFDLSKDMVEKCKTKVKQLDNVKFCKIECCGFNGFSEGSLYDFVFIPSGSFSLIIKEVDIRKSLEKLYDFTKKGGRIVLELETDLNFDSYNLLSGPFSTRTVKKDGVEIAFSQKIVEVDNKNKVLYTTCTYRLFVDGEYSREEQEVFNTKYYGLTDFEEYLEGIALKIQNKYINYNKDDYLGQKTDKIIYKLVKC